MEAFVSIPTVHPALTMILWGETGADVSAAPHMARGFGLNEHGNRPNASSHCDNRYCGQNDDSAHRVSPLQSDEPRLQSHIANTPSMRCFTQADFLVAAGR